MNTVLKDGNILTSVILLSSFIIILVFGILPQYDNLSNPYFVGPDSYYNLRTCKQTLQTGHYPYDAPDSLLDYPLNDKGARPPLFNMVAIIISSFIGHLQLVMAILPVIYGALCVFPLYHLTRDMTNKKIARLSVFLFSITPIITSYSVSYFGRFDHDSFVLLLLLLILSFLVKSLKTNNTQSYLYASLSGLFLGATALSWVAYQIYSTILVIFAVVKFMVDLIQNNRNNTLYSKMVILFTVSTILSLPVQKNIINYMTVSYIAVLLIFLLYYIYTKIDINNIFMAVITLALLVFTVSTLFVVSNYINIPVLTDFFENITSGPYHNKIFSTIAEGNVKPTSTIIIYTGITVFWFAFIGLYYMIQKNILSTVKLLFLTVFFSSLWLVSQAGRFIPYLSLCMIILSSYAFYMTHRKVKLRKILSVVLLIILILPGITVAVIQAEHPCQYKFEKQWIEVSEWFAQQDTNLTPEDRPAVLGWWDYGFFIASVGEHPVVADNFQSGIIPASQFMTSTSEKEILSVLIIRLLEFDYTNTIHTVQSYTGNTTIIDYITGTQTPPSYDRQIGNTDMNITLENAIYMDSIKILSNLSIDTLASMYNELINLTHRQIGYLVISERDIDYLFPVITYLADKGYWMVTYNDSYFYGVNATPKQSYYDTVAYKLYYHKMQCKYFEEVYNTSTVKVYKYTGL